MSSQFKIQHRTVEERKAESERIMAKYPGSFPIVCEKVTTRDAEAVSKKFVIRGEITIGALICVLRRGIKLAPEKALFLFINDITPPNSGLVRAWYEDHKDVDGIKYVKYASENTFGAAA